MRTSEVCRSWAVTLSLAACAAAVGTAWAAPDDLLPGKSTTVKTATLAKFTAKSTVSLPDPNNDPTAHGGVLQFFDTTLVGGAGGDTYPLPAAEWKALGTKGFKFKGAGTPTDPCKTVIVKTSGVKGVCKGTAVKLSPPLAGNLGVVLTLGSSSKRYCAQFDGSTAKKNVPGKFIASNGAAPTACPTSPAAVCGNGVLEPGEACDDGNTVNGDCCSSTCGFEPAGTVCRPENSTDCDVAETCSGTSATCPADAKKPDGTVCNDNNPCFDGSTCTAGACGGGTANFACGDGILRPECGEQCDDGGTTPGDGCNGICEIEGQSCVPVIGSRSVQVSINVPGAQKLAGLQVALEYPQFEIGIPGFGNSSVVRGKVTINQTGGLDVENDNDSTLSVNLANTTDLYDDGPLFTVLFDECADPDKNICNRNQNVIDCCVGTMRCDGDPNAPCVPSTEATDCGPGVKCVIPPACAFNPTPVCGVGQFPLPPTLGACPLPGTTPPFGCPGDNACLTQLDATTCSVSDPADQLGQPIDGVTCTVTYL